MDCCLVAMAKIEPRPLHSKALVRKMSSPASNLRKQRRSPLPQNRSVPFRHSLPANEILNFLEEDPLGPSKSHPAITSHSAEEFDHKTQRQIVDSIRHHPGHKNSKKKPTSQHHGGGVPTDSELLGSMASRLALVERELLAAKREVIEKDNYIHQLEERVAVLERSTQKEISKGEETQRKELELKCLALQKQVDEMEEFLNDYGMVWVGNSNSGERYLKHSPPDHTKSTATSDGIWVPGRSLVCGGGGEFVVDYDAIVRNVKELNLLAGEGKSHVTTTADKCAKLKPVDAIPLTLYKNGIVMFQGPFRPFSDPTTRQCVQDLMDGYYPAELQSRYPEGVPFQLNDSRDVTFKPREYADIFPGSGRQLGGEKGPSKLLPSGAHLRQIGRGESVEEKEISILPGPKVSMENFLSRLPASVVKGGRVLDVRAGVAEVLHGTSSKVTLVETPALQEIKSRLDVSEDLRPPTPAHLTTLRIKSELGDQMYVLKMKHTETIGDVKKLLNKLRPPGSPQCFILKSTFPPRTFTKLSATLSECGLVPNANLFMAKALPS